MFTVKTNLYKKYYPIRTKWEIHEILQYDRGRILKLSCEYRRFIENTMIHSEVKSLEEFHHKVKELEDEYSYARNLENKIASMQLDTITIEDMNKLLAYEYFVGTEKYCRTLRNVIVLAFLLFVCWFALKSCVL